MKNVAIFILVLIIGFTAVTAKAALLGPRTMTPALPFRDWQTMVDYAKSQGIDTNNVDWGPINEACFAIRFNEGDLPAYKCAYDKVRDMTLHASDRSQCTTRAEGAYPDGSLHERTDRLMETDQSGVTHAYQRTSGPITPKDLDQLRSGSLIECMQSLGWASADDWRLGHRNACY
jgi:hypothetical protein